MKFRVPELFEVCKEKCGTSQLECITRCDNDYDCISECNREETACKEGMGSVMVHNSWTNIFISCPFNTHDMDLKPVFQTRHYFKVVRVAPTVLRAVTTVTTQFVICPMKMQF